MNYVLDLVIVVLIIGCAAAGSRKGALKMLITLVGYFAAVALASFVSNVASEYVYENILKQYVLSVLETKAEDLEYEYFSTGKINEILMENGVYLDEYQLSSIMNNSEQYDELLNNDKIRESINDLFTDYCEALTSTFSGIVPEQIIDEAKRYIKQNNMENYRFLTLVTQEKDSIIKIIESEIIKPVMIRTIKLILFAITFALVMITVSVIIYAVKVIRKIPVLNSADGFLGTLLGLIQGVMYILVANLCISMFIKFTADTNKYINTVIISETYIFGLLYDATFYLLHQYLIR